MKRTIKVLIIIAGLLGIQWACSEDPVTISGIYPVDNANKVTVKQGVWGNVWFWEGDFMPTIGPEGPDGTITPVSRKVLIYEKTHTDEVESPQDAPNYFINNIKSSLVKVIYSDEDGFFETELPQGEYSVFVEERPGVFYANGSDGQGYIKPFEVYGGRAEKVQIDITYKAAF